MLQPIHNNNPDTLPIDVERFKQCIADWSGSGKPLEYMRKTKRFSAQVDSFALLWKRSNFVEDLMFAATAVAGKSLTNDMKQTEKNFEAEFVAGWCAKRKFFIIEVLWFEL